MPYNLEQRTAQFSKAVIDLCKQLPKNTVNFKLIDQIVRSASSVGANYIEANEALSKKDFLHRLRISRKEAKETSYWLELIQHSNPEINSTYLIQEAKELRNILSAIITKTETKL